MNHAQHALIPLTLLILPLTAGSSAQTASRDGDVAGLLYKSVFYSHMLEYDPERLDTTGFPKQLQERIRSYVSRRKAFQSKLDEPENKEFPALVLLQKRRSVERAIVALVEVAGIEKMAADYASKARLYYEWEGMSDGPLGEAQFAETYLSANPATPLRPYLLLFLLHRYRCAYECLGFEKNLEGRAKAEQKYQLYLKQARANPDPLIALVADDIDRAPYLYIKTDEHP